MKKRSHKYRERTKSSFDHQRNPNQDQASAAVSLFIVIMNVCVGRLTEPQQEDAGTMQSHGLADMNAFVYCVFSSPGSSNLIYLFTIWRVEVCVAGL